MGGIALAWLFGESLVTWRWVKAGAPPTPGALLLSSGVFAGLALLAQAQQARTLAATLAWGFDLAIVLQLAPGSKVKVATGWPPGVITDPSVILPTGHSHTPAGFNTSPASPKAGGPGAPGTPVPGQPGVSFPPGSGNL